MLKFTDVCYFLSNRGQNRLPCDILLTASGRKGEGSVKKAVIYARYSSDMQREESIDAQVRACTYYAHQYSLKFSEHMRTERRPANEPKTASSFYR